MQFLLSLVWSCCYFLNLKFLSFYLKPFGLVSLLLPDYLGIVSLTIISTIYSLLCRGGCVANPGLSVWGEKMLGGCQTAPAKVESHCHETKIWIFGGFRPLHSRTTVEAPQVHLSLCTRNMASSFPCARVPAASRRPYAAQGYDLAPWGLAGCVFKKIYWLKLLS
jgi:hypothetical protein